MRSCLSKGSLRIRIGAGLGILAGFLTVGCVRQPILKVDALPVKQVVVYRNGVAYFERGGHVEGDEVRFMMKQKEVGDFLATLAVMEQGGSSVRAAAFPLALGDEDADVAPQKEKTEDEKKLRTVILSLDGNVHDLQVGYIAESPVWKPSYRLVVRPEGQADLQAWGIVENLSGEDWKDVKLTLIAGAPLSFEAQLGDPVIPERPTVTDQGEVIVAVPRGETSLEQDDLAKKTSRADAESRAEGAGYATTDDNPSALGALAGPASKAVGSAAFSHGVRNKPLSTPKGGPSAGAPAPPPAEAAPVSPSAASVMPSQPRNVRSLAAIAAEGGTTRYDLPSAVTVPDKSATMVMLLARRVPGGALFLYAPDAGVADSTSHPFRVARFANKSGGALERGPIAVFEEGSFLGQGLVDPLPDGAVATVPFALERSIAIDRERKRDEQGARIVKIENGELTVESDSVTQTNYRLRNGGDAVAKMLVKHTRQSGTRLFSPPKDTEDNVGTGSALVPATIAPHATGELVVDERATFRRQADWFTPLADNAFKAYAIDPKADREVAAKLAAAWLLRGEIVQKQDARGKLQQESGTLSQSTEETRRNLRAIEKNKVADTLRARLTQRLAEASLRLDEITKQIVELDAKLSELRVRFKEGVRDLKLWIAPTSTP